MKAIKQVFSALCSLTLLAGCMQPVDDPSESDELGDEVTAEDEAVESAEQALAVCTYNYPSDTGVGERTSATGCFQWGFDLIRYSSKGAVNNGGSMAAFSTPAKSGDFEILALGASNGGNNNVDVDTYFDKSKMEGQSFQAIGVRGSQDKKIELWVRKNTGQTSINPPSKAKSYNVFVLNGADVQLNLSTITKSTVQSRVDGVDNGTAAFYKVPSLADATRLNVVAYYGDDPFEVMDTKGGQLLFNKWGFGDLDSLNVMFYEPHDTPPSTITVKDKESSPKNGNEEYVGIRAHFFRK